MAQQFYLETKCDHPRCDSKETADVTVGLGIIDFDALLPDGWTLLRRGKERLYICKLHQNSSLKLLPQNA